MAIEEPEYQIIDQFEDYELRKYSAYIVAEVDVPGDFDEAGRQAFRILAGYIFGDNAAAQKMAMTAQVESKPSTKGESMSMTAPVTAVASNEDNRTTYTFVMERKYTLQTLPVPNDDRIRIRTVPERTMAVRRYSGRWSEKKYMQNKSSLRAALEEDGMEMVGQPVFARYNSPFSLPFMRRNEVMVEVIPAAESSALSEATPFGLSQYQWKQRVLVVSAPSRNDKNLTLQQSEVALVPEDFADRDMVLVTLQDDAVSTAGDRNLTTEEARIARNALNIDPDSFALRLIGKDGSVKLKGEEATSMTDIFALIDTMPMRRNSVQARLNQ